MSHGGRTPARALPLRGLLLALALLLGGVAGGPIAHAATDWRLPGGGWVERGDLEPNDTLLLAAEGGEAAVLAVTAETAAPGARFTTHNLEVAFWHTYFVAPKGSPPATPAVWVHNDSGKGCDEIVAQVERMLAKSRDVPRTIVQIRTIAESADPAVGARILGTVESYRARTPSARIPVPGAVSSGVDLVATPGRITAVLGRYSNDMQSLAYALGNRKPMDFRAKPGGFNVMNVWDKATRSVDFWEEYNRPFLDAANARRDIFMMATRPDWSQLTHVGGDGKVRLSGFGREYLYLRQNGYRYDAALGQMVRRGSAR